MDMSIPYIAETYCFHCFTSNVSCIGENQLLKNYENKSGLLLHNIYIHTDGMFLGKTAEYCT